MKPVSLIALAAACCFANAAASGAATPAAAAVPATAVPASAVSAPAVVVPSTTSASAPAAAAAASAAPVPAAPAVAAEPAPVPASEALAMPARVGAPAAAAVGTAPGSAAGSLLQTILALVFVLALLGGLAWLMKRYGPKAPAGNTRLRLLSSLSLGGRERIMLIEVADQWIVVGASPGRVNALATLPRQEEEGAVPGQPNSPAAANFAEWLKLTIDKRNGK